MPDEVEIGISVKSTGDGVAKTDAELKQLAQTNAQLTAEMDKVTKSAKESAAVFEQAHRTAAAEGMADHLSKLTEESKQFGNETTQKTEPSIKRLAAGFKQLGHEIPLVGVAINALKNPWTFLGAAVAGAFVWFTRMIEVQKELIRTGAELSARLDPLIVQQVRTKQIQAESAAAADNFNRKLNDQADALAEVRDRQREANEQLDNRNRLEAAIEDADKQVALAEAGKDPEARARVEADFRNRARQRESLINAGKIGIAHTALVAAKQMGIQAEAQLPGARADLAAVKERAGGELDDVGAALRLNEEEGARLQKELAEAETFARGPFAMPGIGETAAEKVAKARAAVQSHRGQRDALLARQQLIQAGISPFQDRVTGLEQQATQSRNTVPGLQSEFNRLVGTETTQRQIFSQTEPALAKVAQLQATNAALLKAVEDVDDTIKRMERIMGRIPARNRNLHED